MLAFNPVEPTCSQRLGAGSAFRPGTLSQIKTVERNTNIMDFLYLLISQWIQGSQGHAQHLKDWSWREQSSRHCACCLAKNLGADFCQQQVKAARVCCLPGRIHIQLFGDKQFKNNTCVQQGGADLHFKLLRKPVGQPCIFNQSRPGKWNWCRCVCLDCIQCWRFSRASCCTAKAPKAVGWLSCITLIFHMQV